jgi:hypothetical protein
MNDYKGKICPYCYNNNISQSFLELYITDEKSIMIEIASCFRCKRDFMPKSLKNETDLLLYREG